VTTEVVLLDAGGTLFTEVGSRDEAYASVFSRHGVCASAAMLAPLRAAVHDEMPESYFGAARYSDLWFREFIRRLLARLGARADAEAIRRELAAHFESPRNFAVFPDTLPALEELGARGLRLGVVSNWSDRLHGLLDGLSLSRHFEFVVISAVIGASKPDRAIFHHALRLFGTSPARALHVGDHPLNDLQGARRCGLPALLLDRAGEHPGQVAVIRSLEDICGRLAPLG